MKLLKKLFVILSAAAVFTAAWGRAASQRELQQTLSSSVLRFHVRANSNSRTDQLLKLKVRNAVGGYLKEELKEAESLDESRRIAQEDLAEITAVAERVLAGEGSDDTVRAVLSPERFPEKTYGNVYFPQGDYEALVLEIGSGKGKNWWCVMYPNLCFSGAFYEVDENGERLREVVGEKEYAALLKEKNYTVSWRALSYFKQQAKGND